MRLRRFVCVGAVSLLSLLVAATAMAGDGVRYLRNTSLLPIVISRSGTYRLKSDLVATNPNDVVLRIDADDVTIDLNGFAIRGPAVCTGTGINVECTGTGGGVGISSEAGGARPRAVRVMNGSIRGLGGNGIEGSAMWHIENVRLVSNGASGAELDGQGQIVAVTAFGNNGDGIGSYGVQVKDSDASGNLSSGIEVTDATVTNCVVSSNGNSGISAFGAVVANGNVALANGSQGIEALAGSVVAVNNSVRFNRGGGASCSNCALENNAFYLNDAGNDGSEEVVIHRSTFRGNAVEAVGDVALRGQDSVVAESYIRNQNVSGAALHAAGDVGINGNALVGGGSDIDGPGNAWELGSNICGIDTSCP